MRTTAILSQRFWDRTRGAICPGQFMRSLRDEMLSVVHAFANFSNWAEGPLGGWRKPKRAPSRELLRGICRRNTTIG